MNQSESLEPMEDFERELTRAMRPVDAPEGFAARVLAQAASMESMSEIEVELAQTMRRVDAPEGFAERVMGRAAKPEVHRAKVAKVLTMPWRMQLWVGSAIAAALLVGAFGVREQRERRQREEAAAQARQQFDTAIQITGQTLADAHAQQQFEVAMQITAETMRDIRAQLQQAGVAIGD